MRPLAMSNEVDQDPFIGLFASLEHLQKNERGVIQVLFKGAINPWAESVMRSVTDNKGGSFFEDAPEMVKLAQVKVSAPLFSVCIKVAGQSATRDRAIGIASNIGSALVRLTRSQGNSLIMLSQEHYEIGTLIDDVYLRETHRIGMLLNCRELATIVHFPTPEIASQKVERDSKKTKAAPESAQGYDFVLGNNLHHGNEQVVSVPSNLRLRHTHIIGATGTGKSTLILSMIAQDMQQGNGIAVLDPHGDLIESILAYVPQSRIQDVILIDPADGEYPVGFNILSAHSEIEKDILSSDLVAAFKRLSTSWGDQMNSVFANAILAFLESKDGGTLVDLRRFLVEKPFRDAYLKTVSDPHVVYYWEHEYPLLKSNSIGSILTRLDTFLRPKLIRNMVAQKKGLDFENILDSKKILLIKLSQGLIGAENSFLLGTFFVSKIYQAAMARQAKSKADRSDFFMYIDEFQNFITPSMSYILSGARKYHLGLILAHQDMHQLTKYDTELASSVVVNSGTRICFRLGDTDAKRFGSGFSYFDAEDLENLHIGEAIARIEQPNFDFNLTTIPLQDVPPEVAEVVTQAVIAKSREQYGTSREIVEQSLAYLGKVVKEQPKEPKIPEVVHENVIPPQPVETPVPFVPVEIPKATPPVQKVETQHRYLQTLIKRMAESRGYKATTEELTPDGRGRVDVSLERSGKRIACEVSVTTGDEWEAHNVEKCLAAGYDEVIVCSNDVKNLQKIRKQVEVKISKELQHKVFTFEIQEVIHFFDTQIVQESKTEKIVKGYRVKVEYDTTTVGEMAKKQENVVKAVTDSLRKKR
jgi:SHS2 domain-containing protein